MRGKSPMKDKVHKHAVALTVFFASLQTAPLFGMLMLKNMNIGAAGVALSTLVHGVSSTRPFTKDIFIGKTAVIGSPINPLRVGIVNANYPGVADVISGLLVRSISDSRESNKIPGHLPDHFVDYILKHYVAPDKITSLWADYGKRFAVLTMGGEIVGTVHVASSPDTILYYNRSTHNVPSSMFPGFKPEGYHHIMNLAVKHELRRLGLARLLMTTIAKHFHDILPGRGLWMRADPPWHDKLLGVGFKHDPSMDSFLDEEVERTLGMPHADYNKKYWCTCIHPNPGQPAMLLTRAQKLAKKKLQYVSCTYDFAPTKTLVPPQITSNPAPNDLALTCAASILKFYQYKLDSAPHGFTFDWPQVLDIFKRRYCKNTACKKLGAYFSDLKGIITGLQQLSAHQQAALERAVNSSRNDIQIEDVPAAENVPINFLSNPPLKSQNTAMLDSSVLEKFDMENVVWNKNEEYVVDRVGPVHLIIDQLRADDMIVVSNLEVSSYCASRIPPSAILKLERINLPISSYEKEIWLITHKNNKRTLFFGKIKGKNYLVHYGLLLKRYLQLTTNPACLTQWISLDKNLPEYSSLKTFVGHSKSALQNVTALVFGYAPVCKHHWSKYYKTTIDSDNKSWKAEIYALPDMSVPGGHTIAVLSTRLPMHGEILAENFNQALFELPMVKYLFIGGTAGALTAKFPYNMIFPQLVKVPSQKQSIPNVLAAAPISPDLALESHTSVLSPLIETPEYLTKLRGAGITTIDMEVGYLAAIAEKYPNVHIGVGLIITDFPVYPFAACTLFTKDMRKHSKARSAFPEAIYHFLVDGETVPASQIERRFGSLSTISQSNLAAEKALLGKLSPAEELLEKKLINELAIGFFIRVSKNRLWQALNHKIFLASMLAGELLAKPTKPTTPPLEDQIFGAHSYIYGIVGTVNDIKSYGDVIIKVKESARSKFSWASKYSGWWAAQRLEKQWGTSIISGKETIENEQNLRLVQDQFKRWIFAPENYRKAIALLTISHLRHKPAALFQKFLTASTQELHALMQEHNFGKLEGKMPFSLELHDIEKVMVPADTSPEVQELLKKNTIPFEFM